VVSRAQTVPSVTPTEVAFVIPCTVTGVALDWLKPSPSWPSVPLPQHLIVPPCSTAQVV